MIDNTKTVKQYKSPKKKMTKRIEIYRDKTKKKQSVLLCDCLINIEDFSYERILSILLEGASPSENQKNKIFNTIKEHYEHICIICSVGDINCLPSLKKTLENTVQLAPKIKRLEKELNHIQSMLRPLPTRQIDETQAVIETFNHHTELCYAFSNYKTHLGTLFYQAIQMKALVNESKMIHSSH